MLFVTLFSRSVPLKSQLNTYTEKGKIPVLDFLSAALESVEYERALARGLVSANCMLRDNDITLTFIYFPYTENERMPRHPVL